MTYTSTVTSKGTITLPADVRRALQITPGQQVDIEFIEASRAISIRVPMSIEEVRKMNQAHLRKQGIVYKPGEAIDHDEVWSQIAMERYKRSIDGDA